MLRVHSAAKPAERPGEERWAADVVAQLDSGPKRDRWDASREVLRDGLLVRRQQADAELAGAAKKLVELGLVPSAKPTRGGSSESDTSEPTVRPVR